MEKELSFEGLQNKVDDRPEVQLLLKRIKEQHSELKELLDECNDHWGYEDMIYRFYHQSHKVYRIQSLTDKIVSKLKGLQPDKKLNEWFEQIISEGTGIEFDNQHNKDWLKFTRPMIEAFFHSVYFLEAAVLYGKKLEYPPLLLPSGWAALLYLYDLR